jgi:ATP-binding cassette subfamily B protein
MSTSHGIIEEDKIHTGEDSSMAWRLVAYIRPYWKMVTLASVLSLLVALLTLAGPKIVQVAIDRYIMTGEGAGILHMSLLYLLVTIVIFGLEYAREWSTAYVGQKAMFDLRRDIFNHIQGLSLPYFDRHPVGRIMTRVTSDVAALNEMFAQGLTTLAGTVFMLIAIAGIMLYKNWMLTLIIFASLPLLLGAAVWFRRTVRKGYREVRAKLSQMNAYLQENLSGIRTVQAYNRTALNFVQFQQLNDEHRQANLTTVFAYAVFLPITEIVAAIALASIIWYGGVASLTGSITVGTIVLFIQYSQKFYQPVKDLSEKFNVFQTAMASGERIFQLLDQKADVPPPASPVAFSSLKSTISFDHIWFAYKSGEWVLRDINFEVKRGETIALVGATGSGKTTITSLLARFYDVQKGAIRIDGIDIRSIDPHDLRRKMAVVLQDNFLFTGTIASNIRLGNENITDEAIRTAAANVNALGFIESQPRGFDQQVLERGATLSVGQKQLLAFARALAFDPDILILDEATASIDTETELLIQDALEKLLRNRTSIVIAHRLSTIQNADRILVMHHGQIRESGTHAELLQENGLYRRLYDLQYSTAAARG